MTPVPDTALRLQNDRPKQTGHAWQRFFALSEVDPSALTPSAAISAVRGTTPSDVVLEEGSLKLLRYRNKHGVRHPEPVLICYSLVNRSYILDLQPDRSVVRHLLEGGFDVYLIDWGVPTAADRSLRLEDYVCGRMKSVGDLVRRRSGCDTYHLFGYCMGGTLSAMFTALHPEQVRTLTLLAAPIDFSGDECLLHVWTQEKYFDVDRLIDAYGNCPAALLQAAFQLMKPVQNFIEKYVAFYENLGDDRYAETFFAVERWGQDNVPVAGETFRQIVKCLYQRDQLVKGECRLGDRPVDLGRITCPLLLLTAAFDHLVPPRSTLGILPHVRSGELKQMSINAGHVGLAVSSKAHRRFWPDVVGWLAAHAGG
jgi:polyhydroxyalkanoate synthase